MGGVPCGGHGRGHAWQWECVYGSAGGGMHGKRACVAGGMHGRGVCGRGHAWLGVCMGGGCMAGVCL